MRFATIVRDGTRSAAIVTDDVALPLRGTGSLLDYVRWTSAERAAATTEDPVPLGDIVLDAPVRPQKNVFCVGRNYAEHAAEISRAAGRGDAAPSDVPTFFTKAPTAIVAPGEPLRLDPGVSAEYDWEAELAVVIGRRCRDVPLERALEVIFGYTCLNDVTARDLQRAHKQWFKGKTLDGTCPIGPWVISVDALGDASGLDILLRVNGVTKQHANTRSMIFGVAAIVASLSRGMTLEPGDVIATGTPEGVGFARTPPEFLHDGDVMEIEIERIGVLRNAVALAATAL